MSSLRKIVLVRRKSRLDGLVARYNTVSQAAFVMASQGQDITDYQREHDTYYRQLDVVREKVTPLGLVQEVDREFLPNFIFGPHDLVVAVGQDGLVANTLKYLDGQLLFGVNPDAERWDGILLPFLPAQLDRAIEEALRGSRQVRQVTMAEASLGDGQVLRAVNDLFIGQRSHVSYRYSLEKSGKRERQSSSGVIVSTGMGSTGWYRSLMTGAEAVARSLAGKSAPRETDYSFPWDAPFLRFTVREPFPSRHSAVGMITGEVRAAEPLTIFSETPEGGIIFSDGVEKDAMDFNSGAVATISLAARAGNLVV